MDRSHERVNIRQGVALALAAAICFLAATYVFDQLGHLKADIPASPSCAICVWARGAIAGATIAIALVWLLLLLGACVPAVLIFSPATALPASISRGPPVLA